MTFNYSKLRGKIVEVYGSIAEFSDHSKMSRATIFSRFRGESNWRQDEIIEACNLLGIAQNEIATYFFDEQVVKSPTEREEK